MTLNQLDREPLDKRQPPLLLTSHPEVCDTRFLGVHSSLSPGSPWDNRAFSLPAGSPRFRGSPMSEPSSSTPRQNYLLPSSFSTSASQALAAHWDLSEPRPPHPQGGIKDHKATSGGWTTDPGVAPAVTTGRWALQTPGQDTEAENCPNAESRSWNLWMPGVFLFVDCWCNLFDLLIIIC